MTRLHRIPSDFCTPKVRDSFVSKFVYDTADGVPEDECIGGGDGDSCNGQNNPNEALPWINTSNLRYREGSNLPIM